MNNTQVANLEAAGQASPKSGVKLYVFVGMWDGVPDTVSVHATKGSAVGAFESHTEAAYAEGRDVWEAAEGYDHWGGSDIHEITLRKDQLKDVLGQILEQAPGLRECEYPGCGALFFPELLGQDCYFCPAHEEKA